MKRADRRDDSFDNSIRNPRSQQSEPIPYQELRANLMTLRAQRSELQQRVQETEKQVEQTQQLYLEEQHKHQSTLVLYHGVQSEVQSYLTLYNEEKTRSGELLVKYEQAQAETQHYLMLYNEAQTELKFERRSKAGIKGWETRRKRENERLKQEIGEMVVLLRDSLVRKDEAINNLESLAERMDRIQYLVDSVEGESSNNPVNFVQKIARIWQAIKDILAE
jgi:chromosome segregation ATPase